jgi:hypothetical protein
VSELPRPLGKESFLAGVLAAAAILLVYTSWGGLAEPGLIHDEKAYLLQARIYAGLHWSEPSPPVPELWEQMHVFTEPRFAARYPPGYSAVLALGAAVGLPGLVQVLLAGVTAALLFLFATRLVGKWIAFAATALWLAAPSNTSWRTAYFSESLTGLLWVAWSWLAWRYRRDGRLRDLALASVLVAFAGITRPVTAVVLALPLIVVLWPRLRAPGGLRHAALAVAAGLPVCALVPIWSHAVLGSWTTVPYPEYSVRNFPFDMPTFDTDWSPPPRELPPDLEALAGVQRVGYEGRSRSDIPGLFLARLDRMGSEALPPHLGALRWLAPLGLLAAGGVGWVALASALLLVLGYIAMPHDPGWTIYYLEAFPVVSFGVVLAAAWAAGAVTRRTPGLAAYARHGPSIALVAGMAFILLGGTAWEPRRLDTNGWIASEREFRAGICALPPGEKIVFVQRRPDWSVHHSLIQNDPRWHTSGVWVVRTWTADRHRALMAAAPERDAYVFDMANAWFVRMGRDGAPETTPVLRVDEGAVAGRGCG